ncbi:MAG: EamA family transporter [Methylotenera sp.]|nr:EamA family transporter [Oligoflexia bacterium]
MIELVLASFIWAFSFGLIKTQLHGLNSFAVAGVRLALSFLVFLPFAKWPRGGSGSASQQISKWMAIGTIQFGLMYTLYMKSFEYLQAHEVAVLTITTPLMVVLINAALEKKLRLTHLLSASLAIAAGLILMMKQAFSGTLLLGVLLVQGSNLFFAAGQLLYRRAVPAGSPDLPHFAWIYLGAAVIPLLVLRIQTGVDLHSFEFDQRQWLTLLYLGIFPTGLGFYLWNRGAKKVEPGVLAVMNNLKIPLGAGVAWLVFQESVDAPRMCLSFALFVLALHVSNLGPARS